MLQNPPQIPIIKIGDPDIEKHDIQLFIKREDQIDPYISGNKFRKLKYNLLEAKNIGHHTILTFGGAFSNHIHAVAYAGYKFGFKTIGIIRGEEKLPLNATLKEAQSFGMQLHYISRSEYKNKLDPNFNAELKSKFGKYYLVPEGGSNVLAVQGSSEIIDEDVLTFNHICCASGTGGTLAGIIAGLHGKNKVWGFPALKNAGFLKEIIADLILNYNGASYTNWNLILDYHFGGYAKYNWELIAFINRFKQRHNIQLDPIYTGKLLFGIYDLVKKGFFDNGDRILAIHTGGLQGIRGFNDRFGNMIK
jgi:1-aminocyclopropane-1-carboxylate deaminase/D-cysteine desulfhydrase-like pyridoxal-dependent ACC family enzyme